MKLDVELLKSFKTLDVSKKTMQPILLLAIVGVAAVALSMGSLTNVINLDVQDFGVGEETIETPVTQADVDFNIGQVTTGGFLYNVIDICTITPGQTLDAGSTLFCKLTNIDDQIVAEGHKTVTTQVDAGDPVTIPITQLVLDDPPFSHNVKNIHDVLVVIQGP